MQAATKPPKENNILGDYRLSRIIGEGTFGKVQLGIHIPTGQKVAIKILQKQKIVDQSDIELVTREICILKILRHPNIVHLYEIIETQDSINLIMQYAEGGELFEHIVRKRRLSQKEAVKYFQQLLSGVQYLHANGVVHRDLKPENLLFDGNDRLKIVDFGLSNQYTSGEKLKTACGSPCYAAPEMIAGRAYECSGVDVWSCGIILFAMLCGYLPFQDENTNKLYKKILTGDLHLPKHLSEGSKQILRRILNVNPETRYTIEKIRESAWFNQTESKYYASGIIVGKDQIQVDDEVVGKMEVLGYDTTYLRTYLSSNKHNYLTALYYLLVKKMAKTSALTTNEKNIRTSSKLIQSVRKQSPNKYQFRAPTHFNQNSPRSDRDQSLNATKIISSLTQANKKKIVTPSAKPVVRKYQNKPFPRQIERPENSSVSRKSTQGYSPRQNSSQKSTSLDSRFTKTFNFSNHYSPPKTTQQYINPGQQDMTSRLRQYSHRFRQQIRTTAGYQPISQALFPKSQVSFRNNQHQEGTNPNNLAIQQRFSFHKKQLHESQAVPARGRISSGTKNIHPYIHSGPFNANCLFMENPGNLLLKIVKYLRRMNVSCKENDHLTLIIGNGEEISIQSFQGVMGYYVVKFSNNSPLCQQVIEHLRQ